MIGRRHRGLQRVVAGEQAGGADQLLAAGVELAHEQRAGQPELLADLVAGGRAHGHRDDEQADGENDGKQPDEDGDQPTAEAPKTHGVTSPRHTLRPPCLWIKHRRPGGRLGGAAI
ncbi:MAG TPA: hypothetical protein VLV15_13810 [Dongiaceae bacterium]|nr:hypothetical protein [Dongiaceae bacterium]